MYLTDNDRKSMKSVEDQELNEVFQEALEYDPSLLINSWNNTIKRFWRKNKLETVYQIYHDDDYTKPPYQARYQLSACGNSNVIKTYLYGIMNGSIARDEKLKTEK